MDQWEEKDYTLGMGKTKHGIQVGSNAGVGTRTGTGPVGNTTGLNSHSVDTAGPEMGAVSETYRGQFDDRKYRTEVIHARTMTMGMRRHSDFREG